MGAGRKPFWPDMEAELVRQFLELRAKGLKVRSWWFEAKGNELMTLMHPDVEFKISPGWFDTFKKCHKLSYRATTNTDQHPPSHLESAVRDFHRAVLVTALRGPTSNTNMGPLGQYELRDIANMVQTPLPFVLNGGKEYETQGAKTVWHRGGVSGLDKWQCTAQLTIFVDGVPRVKPLLIFRGKGLRIAEAEKKQYDSRFLVRFQENAWCDENVMKFWSRHMWKRP